MTQTSLFDDDEQLAGGWSERNLRRLQIGDPWPEPVLLVPDNRCERRRPGGDLTYDRCSLTLEHEGEHAEIGFSDVEPRDRVRYVWKADPPQVRSQWVQYRRQTQGLLDARTARSIALDQDQPVTAELDDLASRPVPYWEDWIQTAVHGFPLGMPGPAANHHLGDGEPSWGPL